jgi:hypothetical protein
VNAVPSSRLWVAGGVFAALLIMVASWILLVGPARADAQTLRDDTTAVEGQNAVLEAKVAELREQAENRGQLEKAVEAALAGLPADVSLPEFNRQLIAQAAGRSVEITNVSVAPPTTVGQTDAAPAPEEAPAGATEETPTATQDPVPATGALAVPVVIQSRGPALAQLYFLRDIQELGPRRALVTATALTATDDAEGTTEGDANELSTLTIQLTVFAAALSESDRQQLAELLGKAPAS